MGKSQCIDATATQRIAMFQLAQSIESWKKQFYYRKGISPWDIYELSQHLEEEIALHQAKGLSDEIAFQLATEHLGKPELIENEYSKLDRSKKNGISLKILFKIFRDIFCQYSLTLWFFFFILSALFVFQWGIYAHFLLTPAVEILRILLMISMFLVVGIFSFCTLAMVQFKKIPSLGSIIKHFQWIVLFVFLDYVILLTSLFLNIFFIFPGVWFYSRFFLTPWILLDDTPNLMASFKMSFWLSSIHPWQLLFFSMVHFICLLLWYFIGQNPLNLLYQASYFICKTVIIALIYYYLSTVPSFVKS
ncbi:MAG TPA: hypothetical protein PK581_00585 [Caldisericia bacterium]|nr:hypothetical protein [Caldisericia bacterium]